VGSGQVTGNVPKIPTLASKTKLQRGWGTQREMEIHSQVPKCEAPGAPTFFLGRALLTTDH
jgi:hypothetical protein